jgi:NAD kinase
MSIDKIVIVTRQTRLESLIERYATKGQAKFHLERQGADFGAYEGEHATYQAAVGQVHQACRGLLGRVHVIDRGYLPTYLFTPQDLVVAVGPDGLVVNAAKYLTHQPIVGVNPDPRWIDGILLPFTPVSAQDALRRAIAGHARIRPVTMAEAALADGQKLLAFNDLFIGPKTHTSARYRITYAQVSEAQASSGVIVSTGAGSTGWMASVLAMAAGLAPLLGQPSQPAPDQRLAWEAETLRFAVREPFPSRATRTTLVCGEIQAGETLRLESQMAEDGVIFSDGLQADYLPFNAGAVVSIGVSSRKAHLVA